MADKKSFVLYTDYSQHLALLADDERGRLFAAIFDYAGTGVLPQLNGPEKIAFSFIRAQMDRDADKYTDKCEKNRQNGAKGGRPLKAKEPGDNPHKPKETERLLQKPTGTQRNPKKHDTDNGNDTDTDTDNDISILPGAVPAPGQQAAVFIEIPLNDGSMYPVLTDDIQIWATLYPAVDVPTQLRKIAGWNDAHPQKRKTARGIKAHINSWLAREQDRGGLENGTHQQGNSPTTTVAGGDSGGDSRNQSRYDYVAGTDFTEEMPGSE